MTLRAVRTGAGSLVAVLLLAILVFSCGSEGGAQTDAATPPEDSGSPLPDLALQPDTPAGQDLVQEDPPEPITNSCVLCHTDKERLQDLAPREEPEEEAGGGG